MAAPPRDLTRTTLAVLLVAILILCSLWVVRPFLPATVWAVTIVVATWPLLLRVRAALWHSRALAVAVTTVVILLVFVAPFGLATATILRRSDQLIVGGLTAFGLVGIFVGPAVLAVSYTLLLAWVAEDKATSVTPAACPPQPGPDQPRVAKAKVLPEVALQQELRIE